MDELNQHLLALGPVLQNTLAQLKEEEESLKDRCCKAELEPYSWDLSAQKGAEMVLEEHRSLVENVEEFKQSVEELVALLKESS
jgi:hypothetical protein